MHQAQEKVSSLQTLIGELEGRLEEERRERENLAGTWEQEMAAMQLQVKSMSQATFTLDGVRIDVVFHTMILSMVAALTERIEADATPQGHISGSE